jgi:hypothetical protein
VTTTAADTTGATSSDLRISPAPTDDEVAAIMAATEALWPRPAVATDHRQPRNTAWRLSGRWWSKPLPVRRIRPWR